MLPGAPGIATKNKKLLGTPGPTTRSKKLLGAKTLPGAPGIDRGDSLRPLSAKAASRDSTVRRARARASRFACGSVARAAASSAASMAFSLSYSSGI